MALLSTFDAFKHLPIGEGVHVVSGEELRKLQHVLTGMVADIHNACQSACIEYVAIGGTALGAVRHKGFIPWDDDLDIAMARADYERFVVQFQELLGEKYYLQTPLETPDYGLCFSRIRKKGTRLVSRDDYYAAETDQCGIFIDVFVLESLPDNPLLRALHGLGSFVIGFGYSCRRFARFDDYYLQLVEDNPSLRRVFKTKIALGKLSSFASMDSWTRAWYRWNALVKDGGSKYLSIPSARAKYFKGINRRDQMLPGRETVFEDTVILVPRDAKAYLEHEFGPDFMSPPPEIDREKHLVLELDFGSSGEE